MEKKRKLILVIINVVIFILIFLFVWKITERKPRANETIVINDAIIDDSNCFHDSYHVFEESEIIRTKIISKGEFHDEAVTYPKNYLSYQKEVQKNIAFKLKPIHSSDYIISISKSNNIEVEVWKQNLLFRNKRIAMLQPVEEKDGYQRYRYSLKEGETYYLYVKNHSDQSVNSTIEIEQDNWVYAPYGGVKIGHRREGVFLKTLKFQSVYFPLTLVEEIEKWYYCLVFDGWYPEEALTDFTISYERMNQWFRFAITKLVKKKEIYNRFIENIEEEDMDNKFIQTCQKVNCNIQFITEYDGFQKSYRWATWQKQQYFYKYQWNKRVDEYKVFDFCSYEDMLDAEFLEYID